jgi:hypothetical protein
VYLQDKAKKRFSEPSSVTEAYIILNGLETGDRGGAQKFLQSMSDEERTARLREENRGNVRLKAMSKFGEKPISRRSKIYI